MSNELVIKANIIESNHNSLFRAYFLTYEICTLCLTKTVSLSLLRCNTSHHKGYGTRNSILVKFNQYIIGFTNRLKVHISTNSSKLHNSTRTRIKATRLKVVEEKGLSHTLSITKNTHTRVQ